MNKPHKHAELIKQWADGAEIEWYSYFTEEWYDVSLSPAWDDDIEFRVKPKWKPRYELITAYADGIPMSVVVHKAVCNYNIIQQFVEEFETDFNDQNYMLVKEDEGAYDYVLNRYESLGTLRMSKECAKKLCKMLNNGEIEL